MIKFRDATEISETINSQEMFGGVDIKVGQELLKDTHNFWNAIFEAGSKVANYEVLDEVNSSDIFNRSEEDFEFDFAFDSELCDLSQCFEQDAWDLFSVEQKIFVVKK